MHLIWVDLALVFCLMHLFMFKELMEHGRALAYVVGKATMSIRTW